MSPSSNPPAAAAARAAAATAVLVLAALVTPAWANPHAGPVKPLYTGVASLDGAVVVEGTRRGAKARIDATVLFGKDSAVLRPGARERIRQVAQELTRCGPGKVLVVGHTDDLGPADHGLRLSIRRAAAVANTLGDLLPGGYPMTATGKGEQDPAVPNTSEANRRKNRRVVITLDRAEQGCGNGQATGASKPTPEPTAAPTSRPTHAATPTASTSPTGTASPRTPSPAPTGPTRAAAPTPAAPREDRPPATPETAAPPVPVDPDQGGQGRAWDSVLVSNLFLAAILVAVAALALYRRFRRPDNPDPVPAERPDGPPPTPGAAEPAQGHSAAGPAVTAVSPREDGPRSDPVFPQGPAGQAAAGGADRARALQPESRRADVVFPAPVEYGVAARHFTPAREVARAGDLDADLQTWFSPRCDRPRLSLLGPVTVRAHGAPIARRRPFYTELLAFLALRPHGATPDQVADAFTLTPARVRNDMKVLRDWLGTNPRTGRRHLPDARDTAAGRARGMAVYQVEGLLVDLHLFERLLHRADTAGSESLPDLDQALRLVQGQPFDQLRPNGWEWLYEGDRVDLHAEAAIQRARDAADGLRSRTGGTPSAQPVSPFASPDSAQSTRPAPANGGRP